VRRGGEGKTEVVGEESEEKGGKEESASDSLTGA